MLPSLIATGVGVTVTVATAITIGVTVICAVPDLPSLVAVIVTGPPWATADTSPVCDTLATPALLVVHVTVRPVSVEPLPASVVAVSRMTLPALNDVVGGVTTTDATGTGVTVIAAVPDLPSLVAVMVTGPPGAFAVTSPVCETLASAALLVVHATARPVSVDPSPASVVAVSCDVAPTITLAVGGVTETVATGNGPVTVMVAVPLLPALVAVIVTGPPSEFAVTTPAVETLAIAGALEFHAKKRPVSTFEFASSAVAVSGIVVPLAIVEFGGDTTTEAIGTICTPIVAVPLTPSLVAVMVMGPPLARPVTSPVCDTLARVALPVDHVTARPVSVVPSAARVVAVSCAVAPTKMFDAGGDIVTIATGIGFTVIDAAPLLPSLVAVMVTGPPDAIAVTSPVCETFAMVALLVDHTMTRPVSGAAFASSVEAVSCVVAPTLIAVDGGLTTTEATATGAVTVTEAVPDFPSLVAVIVTGPPTATAVTNPPDDTLAIALLLDCQLIARPLNVAPDASKVDAVSCAVPPIVSGVFVGDTVTLATAAGPGGVIGPSPPPPPPQDNPETELTASNIATRFARTRMLPDRRRWLIRGKTSLSGMCVAVIALRNYPDSD